MRFCAVLLSLLLATASYAGETNFNFSSLGAKKALRDYRKALAKGEKVRSQRMNKVEEEGVKAVKKTRDSFVESLKKALKKTMQAGNLDEANNINAAIKQLKNESESAPIDSGNQPLYQFFKYDQNNDVFAVHTNAHDFAELVQLESYRGKEHVLQTHPASESKPAIFSKVLQLPRSGQHALRMSVSHHIHNGINRDWILVVRVNEMPVMRQVVGDSAMQNGWKDIEVDLRRFAGRKVKIEIIHSGGGPESNWNGEHGYWTRAEIIRK